MNPQGRERALCESTTQSEKRWPTVITATGTLLWLVMVVSATVWMINYSNSPGHSGSPSSQWPGQSRIRRDASRPTLILFAHPRCPCTRASLGELELLVAHCPNLFRAHVMFIKPAGTAADWAETDLWQKAVAIPGITVQSDDAGIESRQFGAGTSGQTVLYDKSGQMLFSGGITGSRGHSGDNPGRSAITALLRNETARLVKTPVFGCSLFEEECADQGEECTK